MSRPPDRRRGPGEVTVPRQGPSVEPPSHVTDMPTIAGGTGGDACPRCGVEFAATDDNVLQHCTQLAKGAA